MTNEEQALLNGFFSRTLAASDEELASLYNEAGDLITVDPLLDKDKNRIDTLQVKAKTERNQQYSRGQKEALEKIERELREQYGITSDATGVELVEQIIEAKTEGLKRSKLSDDDFEKHPKFTALKLQFEKDKAAIAQEWEGKLIAKEKEYIRTDTLAKVKDFVSGQIDALKPILPADPAKAATWKKLFMKEFDGLEYQIQDDGMIVPLNTDGSPMQNEHGHIVRFDQIVKDKATSFFEFPKAEARSSAAATEAPAVGVSDIEKLAVKSRDEFLQKSKSATPEERVILLQNLNKLSAALNQ